ncbi:MAG TPA: hypothetical protein VF787_19435 [Thermoanaerobaculia bacterium]
MRNVVAALALLTAFSASAYDFSGNEIFLPVVSRVAGANNTQWRTDLVVSSRDQNTPTEVSMFFFPYPSGEGIQHRFTLEPLQTVTMPDVVLNTFGLTQRAGTIWLGAVNESVEIAANARIYNTGNSAGEFGQVIHGLPPESLSKTSFLHGLTGINGNRTNVGIANPSNTRALFSLTWYDKHGESHGSVSLGIDPWQVLLINDIFTYVGQPADEGMTLRVRSSNNALYAYASIVRNDTGDAYTIIGNGRDD